MPWRRRSPATRTFPSGARPSCGCALPRGVATSFSDARAAEDAFVEARKLDPESTDILRSIEESAACARRERDLVTTLRARAKAEVDLSMKKQLLREAKTLAEGTLTDRALAEGVLAGRARGRRGRSLGPRGADEPPRGSWRLRRGGDALAPTRRARGGRRRGRAASSPRGGHDSREAEGSAPSDGRSTRRSSRPSRRTRRPRRPFASSTRPPESGRSSCACLSAHRRRGGAGGARDPARRAVAGEGRHGRHPRGDRDPAGGPGGESCAPGGDAPLSRCSRRAAWTKSWPSCSTGRSRKRAARRHRE